jgi:DNA mismatch repair protein MutS2
MTDHKAKGIWPQDLYKTLEFDKILQKAQEFCFGSAGKEHLASFVFQTQRNDLELELKTVAEILRADEKEVSIPLSGYLDHAESFSLLKVNGYVLELEQINGLKHFLELTTILKRSFQIQSAYFPILAPLAQALGDLSFLFESVKRIIDEEGQVKKDASPELSRIRRLQLSKQVELQREFDRIVGNYKAQAMLTENAESYRNGRRVLSVPSEYKRRIPGIIHDESSTGRTTFIEPQGVISINNDLFDLEMEERKEIYKLLKQLCAELSENLEYLVEWSHYIGQLDAWHAKFKLAKLLHCTLPQIAEDRGIAFRKVRHPLLLLKNKGSLEAVVPFDLELYGPNKILLLSGPNAGGKSIAMKTVGLVQMMFQHGFLIPADDSTRMSLFSSIFGDIGDSQSIEEDLSTYSSHLKNMRYFTENAGLGTLVLLDEFGGGTDPKLGGAIAEALLERLMNLGVFGVITTHYGNLKAFAFKQKGIVNGAMLFDKEFLKPTYELSIGRPGSSYAFEVATQSGIHPGILKRAKSKAGKSEYSMEVLLTELERDKIKLEERKLTLEKKEKELDRLMRNYQQMQSDFDYKRKKLKLEQKELAVQERAKYIQLGEVYLKELMKEKELEKAKSIVEQQKVAFAQSAEKMQEIQKDLQQHRLRDIGKIELTVGDAVRLKEEGPLGHILSISGKKATLQLGLMKVVVEVEKLIPAREIIEIRSTKSINLDIVDPRESFKSDLDIRGYTREDALLAVQDFMDKALVHRLSQVKILHGKGNGVLKRSVNEKLREYTAIKRCWHPEPERGGEGITLVEL